MNEKFPLVAIADAANDEGLYVGGIPPVAKKTGAKTGSVRDNLKKLEGRGLIGRAPRYREDGGRDADDIQLRLGEPPSGIHEEPPLGSGRTPPLESSRPARAGETATTNGSSSTAREPQWPLEEAPVSDELRAEARALLRGRVKVGTHLVGLEEMVLAAVCMDEFNRQAGKAQGLGPNLPAIVGRIREHPTWDAARHRRLVQSAFRIRWWERSRGGGGQNGRERPLRPNVIYGNTECFANVTADAGDEFAKRKEKIVERRGEFDRSVVRDD